MPVYIRSYMTTIAPTLTIPTPKRTPLRIDPKRLAQLMKKYGKTQAEVAEAVAVTPPAVTKWMNGGSISRTALNTLAARFGVKPADLL